MCEWNLTKSFLNQVKEFEDCELLRGEDLFEEMATIAKYCFTIEAKDSKDAELQLLGAIQELRVLAGKYLELRSDWTLRRYEHST